MIDAIEIRHYITRNGKDAFSDWLSELVDIRAQAKIAARINRLATGNFGDCKALGQGLYELRIDWGAGFHVYLRGHRPSSRLASLWRRQTNAAGRYPESTRVPDRLQGEDEEEMKRIASISHDEVMVRRIRKDPQFAAEYLRAALEESDVPSVLLIALRHVAQARGIAKIAKAAGVERESLYRALSANGNPRLSTLYAVAKAVGLRLTLEAA